MRQKNLLTVVVVIMVLFGLSRIIPYSRKSSNVVNYAPDGFKATIATGVKGVVVEIKQEGQFWVTVNNKKLPFSYDETKFPEGWEKLYPKDFIQVGDTIFKNVNSDTFYLSKGNQSWQYFLPK